MTARYPFAVIKEKLHARRDSVTDFAMGARRLILPPELSDWLAKNAQHALRPAGPDAVRVFKDAATNLLSDEYDLDIGADCIVPLPGGRVAMTAIAACELEPGDKILVTDPGYPAFERLASHWHASACTVALDPEQGFAPDLQGLSPGQLAEIRIFSLNYPNNPSGGVLSVDARASILDAAADAGALVFNDNVYGPLTYSTEPISLLAGEPAAEIVELHALTKLYPVGPQGASFLAGSARTMKKIATYSEFAWAPMSAMQMEVTTWCLKDTAGRAEIKTFFSGQLAALRETLLDIGFEPYPIAGGIYALCKIPKSIAGQSISSAEQAAVILLDDFDLAVVPFNAMNNQYLRFTSMYRPQDLERLQELGDQLKIS